MNPTIVSFAYPDSLVREFEHWIVLVRPDQVTLGSLVLAAKSDATAYGDLPRDAFAEQGEIVEAIERALRAFCDYEKINYLMLMMVDPNPHFHVIPRYSETRSWNGIDFPDAGWPKAPQLGSAVALSTEQLRAMAAELMANFR
jgi:diadenosine tetraphosphate (Ap4A) HIT family hydrolase